MCFSFSDSENMHEITGTVHDVREQAIEYLRKNGFFGIKSPDITLDNSIHPIFAYERFRDLSRRGYENMKPGLRLASHFVSDDRVLQYFWYQMRSVVQPKRTTSNDRIPPVFYEPPHGCDDHPPGTAAQWDNRLARLCGVMSWKLQAPSRTPRDMPMAYSFPFEQNRTAYAVFATQHRSDYEVFKTSNAVRIAEEARISAGIVSWCNDQMGTGWRFRPGFQQQTRPCVLLHGFFGTHFESAPRQAGSNTATHRAQHIGAQFLLAMVLVHELAHCLNVYPVLKYVDPDGSFYEAYANKAEAEEFHGIRAPECGVSWERSIFNKHVIRFVKLGAFGRDNWIYDDISDLAIPRVTDLYDHAHGGFTSVAANGKIHKTTSEFRDYENTLVPWQWIANWFQKAHWSDRRTSEEIMAPPPEGWKMYHEIPAHNDQPTVQNGIIKIEIQVPEKDQEEVSVGVVSET
jgi:hypothetical protein